jgi:hypothetical protein
MARKHGTEHQRNPDFNRLLTALHCGVPDRVPLAEIMIDEGAKEAFLVLQRFLPYKLPTNRMLQ